MPLPDYDVRVIPSVLDRLLDEDPRNTRDVVRTRAESVRDLYRAVQRDLEDLLNTRNPLFDLPPEFAEVRQSAIAYGLPDFSAMNVSNPSDQTRLRQLMENALRYFEPRLSGATVALLPGREGERAVRLRVDARLEMDPAPEPVSFDIVMPLASRKYEVREV